MEFLDFLKKFNFCIIYMGFVNFNFLYNYVLFMINCMYFVNRSRCVINGKILRVFNVIF